jgi:hypothetical protein
MTRNNDEEKNLLRIGEGQHLSEQREGFPSFLSLENLNGKSRMHKDVIADLCLHQRDVRGSFRPTPVVDDRLLVLYIDINNFTRDCEAHGRSISPPLI